MCDGFIVYVAKSIKCVLLSILCNPAFFCITVLHLMLCSSVGWGVFTSVVLGMKLLLCDTMHVKCLFNKFTVFNYELYRVTDNILLAQSDCGSFI